MRKSAAVIFILILSAVFATIFVGVEGLIRKTTHPRPYAEIVQAACAEYAVPEEVVYAVMKTESGFKSDAVSSKGAIGLMQLTPDTFAWLCTKTGEADSSAERLYNPEVNIRYGVCFLSMLYTEFGVWDTCFAAYNAGRTKVGAWMKDPTFNQNGKLVNIPIPETRDYVKKVGRAWKVYKKICHKDA